MEYACSVVYELTLDLDDRRVDLWSDIRLPFEPKGAARDMRTALGEALSILHAAPREALAATYTSTSRSACDAENVLFYNVGVSRFRHLPIREARFFRRFDTPQPAPSGTRYAHHSRYVVFSSPDFDHQHASDIRCAPVARGAFRFDAWRIWHAFKMAAFRDQLGDFTGSFGARVEIEVPRSAAAHPVGILKPVLDGLVTALHVHDGSSMELVGPRLAARLGITESEVGTLLMDGSRAPLGERRLVWPFRDGVQMNPADDLLVEASVVVDTVDSNTFTLRARVFEV